MIEEQGLVPVASPPKLVQLQIELSSDCHARCRMCPTPRCGREPCHMDLALVAKVFGEIESMSLSEPVAFCGLGEPLCHPDAKAAFEIAAKSGQPWALGTNCEGLGEENTQALVRSRPARVVLSFDAMTAETLAKIRPGLSFDMVWGRTHDYLEAVRAAPWGGATWIQMICFPANQHEVSDFLHHFRSIMRDLGNVTIYVKQSCFMPGAEMPPELYPSPQVDIPKDLLANEGGLTILVDDFSVKWEIPSDTVVPCGLPWLFAIVRANGDLGLCCMDSAGKMSVGNVTERAIEEVFASPEADAIRQTLLDHAFEQLPVCELCLKARSS